VSDDLMPGGDPIDDPVCFGTPREMWEYIQIDARYCSEVARARAQMNHTITLAQQRRRDAMRELRAQIVARIEASS
jgi:uncharacterized protein YhaN